MLLFVREDSQTYPGLAVLTHGDFAPVGAQDYSGCLALMPAQVNIYATGLPLCWPCTGQVAINISA